MFTLLVISFVVLGIILCMLATIIATYEAELAQKNRIIQIYSDLLWAQQPKLEFDKDD